MQQAVGGPFAAGGILDVLADDTGALLITTPEKISAVVIVHGGLVLGLIIMLVRQGNPL
jgi:hypothetical protein